MTNFVDMNQLTEKPPLQEPLYLSNAENSSLPQSSLRPLCPTRWTIRTGAIDAVLRNYAALVDTLGKISDETHDDYGRRAGGILTVLERFDTF